MHSYVYHQVLRPIHKNGLRYAWLVCGQLRKDYKRGYGNGQHGLEYGDQSKAYNLGCDEGFKEYQLIKLLERNIK